MIKIIIDSIKEKNIIETALLYALGNIKEAYGGLNPRFISPILLEAMQDFFFFR